MVISREDLENKGWSEEEINQTLKIMKGFKSAHPPFLNKSMYWMVLLLMIIGNFVFSLMMIPLLLAIQNISLYFIIMLLGFSFGMMMSMAIQDIENVEKVHHIVFFSLVPIIGMVNFLLVVNVVNNNIVAELLGVHHSAALIGIVYLLSFMMPYFFMVFKEKWEGWI